MAVNKILRFGESATVIYNDADYSAHAQRAAGYSSGTALQELFNKVGKQHGLMACGLAQFIADFQSAEINDTLTPAQIASYLYDAIIAINPGYTSATTDAEGIIELATTAEAQALADATRAVTPSTLNSSFMGANQSLATNGWQKYPGGKIDMWGTALLPTGTSYDSQTITFPLSGGFPNHCYQVLVSIQGNIETQDDTVSAYDITLTTFKVRSIKTTSGLSVSWSATGD